MGLQIFHCPECNQKVEAHIGRTKHFECVRCGTVVSRTEQVRVGGSTRMTTLEVPLSAQPAGDGAI